MNSIRGWAGILAVCMLAAGAVRAATYEQTVMSDSPYGYWRFNELAGTTAVNLGSGGAALNGNYHQFAGDGTPTLGATGIPGGGAGNSAVRFAGDSQVYIPDTASYTAYTVEAWVSPDTGATTAQNVLVRTQADPRTT